MNPIRVLVCCIVFVFVSALGSYIVLLFESSWEKEQALHLNQVANAQASAFERRLSLSLSSTYLLALEVRFSNGDTTHFESFAQETIRAIGGISNLQLAPDGVIKYIYPLAGNEKAIGHDLLKDDRRRKEARLAISERKLTLAGPFELIQGGVAVIGRNPVFLEEGGKEVFWGFASALIYLEDLLQATELNQLEADGYKYELSRLHPDSGEWEVFVRSRAPLDPISVSFPINVPNSQWVLKMSMPLPLRPMNTIEGMIFSVLLGAIVTGLLVYILREPQRLRHQVNETTKQLNELAFYDALTGLVNRRLFMEQLEYEVKILQRSDKKAALMYLDLDEFKRVNDTLGHNAGDQLLIEMANRFRAAMRESDIICRLGGDEYAILMMNVKHVEDCQIIAEKLIDVANQEVVIEGVPLRVGISIGITIIPDDSSTLKDMLNSADLALYQSKNQGKNRATFFNHDLQQVAVERLLLEQDLRIAIEQDHLELAYQPIVRLDNRQIVMLEALLRWHHHERGLVPTCEFIIIAEQCGLIVPLGEWVMEQACKRLRESLDKHEPVVPIAINISAKQLISEKFAERSKRCFERYQIPPELIEMEITESVLMENIETALEQLNELREFGCRFSIDDFGTGYSSLAQLKQLPVDVLKIDRSFVRDIEHDRHDRQIVEAIIAMSHRLGLSVIAEGVENQSQLDFVHHAGCDLVQGFLFSKPVPYSELYKHELIIGSDAEH